ncbi:phage portal protein [Citrobacter portucalensis]|uniref:phage portal protein n=1 Tax=Citrobacter portucalensis TaxID=1639133 RepID=UPI0032BFBD41
MRQGIIVNAWGRPTGYRVYKNHPASFAGLNADLKTVSADSMLHLAMRKRLHQLRGISLIHGVITRLSDIKDYYAPLTFNYSRFCSGLTTSN